MSNELRLYSKTGTQADWRCPRSRYWGYEFDGKGLSSGTTSIDLLLGSVLHDGLAAIATQTRDRGKVEIDEIADHARKIMAKSLLDNVDGEVGAIDYANEQAALAEGLLRGYYRFMWPLLLGQYPNILLVEESMVYKQADWLGLMLKPDLVLGNDAGETVYVEFKSSSSKKPEWINSWQTSIQVHSTIKGVEEKLGKEVTGVIIQGLYKGYFSYGKQNSPLCYCYKRSGNPPFTLDQILYEYKAGFKKYGTWELEGGVKKWIEEMPEEILAEQFPQTPMMFLDRDLIDSFLRQREIRERDIKDASIEIQKNDTHKRGWLDEFFPQKFDACSPPYGFGCQFQALCHSRAGENPLENGFVYRDKSHLDSFKELI